jgi:anti-anti-sigma factor
LREFRIHSRELPDATVLVLEGELDVASAAELGREIDAANHERSRVVMDLRGLSFMDSTGLRALVAASESVEAAGREFAVVRGPRQVERLLAVTRVAERLTIVDDYELPDA